MRPTVVLPLLVLVSILTIAQQAQGGPEIDREHTKWVDSVLRSVMTIKPGMTRAELLNVFTTEGGLSTRTHRTYVYKECPYIKVDVEFSTVESSGDKFTESPEDTIVKISRPYLAYSVLD